MSFQPAFKQKSAPTPQISMDILSKLETLFTSKRWEIDTKKGMSLYNRFCNTLLKFDVEEQFFLLELTQRFTKINIDQYLPIFEDLAYQIRSDYPDVDIIFAPCLPKADLGVMKSARVALYQMEGPSYSFDLGNCWIEKDDIAKQVAFIKDNTIVVLVDDFVGTGETAIGAVDYVNEVIGADFGNDRIKVLTIVALCTGKQALNDIGVQVYSKYEFKKGISDYFEGDELVDARAKMEAIESKLKVRKTFHFGYRGSEALVCMVRCPNNTFPVYWLGKKTAPYERG